MEILTDAHRKKMLRFAKSMSELEANLRSPRAKSEEEKGNFIKDGLKHGTLMNKVRGKVSADRSRFQRDDVDLDLSYITPNIIGRRTTYLQRWAFLPPELRVHGEITLILSANS
jgi:hypothetical protein